MTIGIVTIAAIGWLAAIPILIWWTHDSEPISRRAWYWSGYDKRVWTRWLIAGMIAGGWPAIIVALSWTRSQQRAELLAEVVERRDHGTRDHHRR